jgi:hypothetical protein
LLKQLCKHLRPHKNGEQLQKEALNCFWHEKKLRNPAFCCEFAESRGNFSFTPLEGGLPANSRAPADVQLAIFAPQPCIHVIVTKREKMSAS